MVITTAQLHSTKPELRFCTGSNTACGMSKIRDGEDLWQWSMLEIRLNAFRLSTILQKQFIIIITIIITREGVLTFLKNDPREIKFEASAILLSIYNQMHLWHRSINRKKVDIFPTLLVSLMDEWFIQTTKIIFINLIRMSINHYERNKDYLQL